MEQLKQLKTYSKQIKLLRTRGMSIGDAEQVECPLARLNYFRFSGYWYLMRRFALGGTALDQFVDVASFELVVVLYEVEEWLRHAVLIELDCVETAVTVMLGYELGRVDPLIYLDPNQSGARVRQRTADGIDQSKQQR